MTTNIPAVSTFVRICESNIPRPFPPITISPTTAPVIERVKPLRIPARIAGEANGVSIRRAIVRPAAPSS